MARLPFYPLLLAVWPVLRLYGDSAQEFQLSELVVPLAAAIGLGAVALLLSSLIWRDKRRAAIVAAALVVPFLTFGLITTAVGSLWPEEPLFRSLFLTLALWLAVLGVAGYVAAKLRSNLLGSVTEALNVVAFILVVVAVVPIVAYETTARSSTSDTAPEPAGAISASGVQGDGPARDIYHIVLDRYGSDDALVIGLGIDNSEFTASLRSRGFQVASDSRANFERTVQSLASTFDMSLLGDVAERMGPDNPSWDPMYDLVKASPVGTTLQDLGYRYLHLGSWYRQTAHSDTADVVVRPLHSVDLQSVLLDQSAIAGLSAMVDTLVSANPDGSDERLARTSLTQLERLHAVAKESDGRQYVFAHVLLPHKPYVLLADGTLDPEEASFATQLEFVNSELDELLDVLLAGPADDHPIIILQADEGPYPARYDPDYVDFDWTTASDEELVMKFGVLNAMYLPGPEGAAPIPVDITLANTYPEILPRYFDIEADRVDDRILASTDSRPYDRYDITELVEEARARLTSAGS